MRGRKLIELSHEGDGEREFGSFESWLQNVASRTDDPTDLDPFLER